MNEGAIEVKSVALTVLFLACAVLIGCAGNSIGMDVVYKSTQCDSAQPGLFALKDRRVFEQMIAKDPPFYANGDGPAPIDLDFEDKHIVVVAMGKKPTAGYRLQVHSAAPTLQGNTLLLPIRSAEPGNNPQAQVVTSPCMILSLDKGAYRIVRVENYVMTL